MATSLVVRIVAGVLFLMVLGVLVLRRSRKSA